MQIAKAYLMVGDPQASMRTWQHVTQEMGKLKTGVTLRGWKVPRKLLTESNPGR